MLAQKWVFLFSESESLNPRNLCTMFRIIMRDAGVSAKPEGDEAPGWPAFHTTTNAMLGANFKALKFR